MKIERAEGKTKLVTIGYEVGLTLKTAIWIVIIHFYLLIEFVQKILPLLPFHPKETYLMLVIVQLHLHYEYDLPLILVHLSFLIKGLSTLDVFFGIYLCN